MRFLSFLFVFESDILKQHLPFRFQTKTTKCRFQKECPSLCKQVKFAYPTGLPKNDEIQRQP